MEVDSEKNKDEPASAASTESTTPTTEKPEQPEQVHFINWLSDVHLTTGNWLQIGIML